MKERGFDINNSRVGFYYRQPVLQLKRCARPVGRSSPTARAFPMREDCAGKGDLGFSMQNAISICGMGGSVVVPSILEDSVGSRSRAGSFSLQGNNGNSWA